LINIVTLSEARDSVKLKKRNWPGSIACKLCGLPESTSHIFSIVRLPASAGVCVPFSPSDADDIYNFCSNTSNKQMRRVLYLFGAVAWSLWLIRNEFVFQNVVIHSPNVGIFWAISFLQKWRVMNKETEQHCIDMVIQKLNLQLSSLRREDQGASSAASPDI
jgi:hypothetical protein